MYSLPFADINAVSVRGNNTVPANTPSIKKGSFTLQAVGDTYLDMSNWGKGCIWVNGKNLGRYWETGPQQTVYVPVEWLKKGQNDVVVLELLKPEQTELKGIEKPILDRLKQ
jgi:beta-galactosidase